MDAEIEAELEEIRGGIKYYYRKGRGIFPWVRGSQTCLGGHPLFEPRIPQPLGVGVCQRFWGGGAAGRGAAGADPDDVGDWRGQRGRLLAALAGVRMGNDEGGGKA